MAENTDNNDTNEPAGNKPKVLAGFLASALDMEDEISNSIYKDYMYVKNWPKNLDSEAFQNIKQYLDVLVKDTQKHKKVILSIIEQYGQDNQP